MSAFITIIASLIGLAITALIGQQFWKIGQHLKTRFPVIFRLYVVFWLVTGLFVLAVFTEVITDHLRTMQHQPCQDKWDALNLEYPTYPSGYGQDHQLAVILYESQRDRYNNTRKATFAECE